jgi:hypothetical protein
VIELLPFSKWLKLEIDVDHVSGDKKQKKFKNARKYIYNVCKIMQNHKS